MPVRSGIRVVNYRFPITDEEQQMRVLMRIHDPFKEWKLSPMDLQARVRREQYAKANEDISARTDIRKVPWHIVEGNDKRRARLNGIDHVRGRIPCQPVPHEEMSLPERVFNPDDERATLPRGLDVPGKY
jgi:polyphosphate kinase 2 (PPK2 family)